MADNRTPKRLLQNREFRPIGDSILAVAHCKVIIILLPNAGVSFGLYGALRVLSSSLLIYVSVVCYGPHSYLSIGLP